MARRSPAANSSHADSNPRQPGDGSSVTDIANAASAALFNGNQLFAQWLTQAQQIQAQMLQGWIEAVNAVGAQQPLLASWAEMQSRWAQQMQEQSAQMVRLLSQQGERAGSTSAASGAAAPFPTGALYEQAQAAFEAMARQWNGALRNIAPRV